MNCIFCDQPISTRNIKFCSRTCYHSAKTGKPSGRKGKPLFANRGELNHKWKGNRASYTAIHQLIHRQKGKAIKCERCGKEKGKIEWANIDHKYSRNPDDYISLCTSCHRKHDIENNNYPVFNKVPIKKSKQ